MSSLILNLFLKEVFSVNCETNHSVSYVYSITNKKVCVNTFYFYAYSKLFRFASRVYLKDQSLCYVYIVAKVFCVRKYFFMILRAPRRTLPSVNERAHARVRGR